MKTETTEIIEVPQNQNVHWGDTQFGTSLGTAIILIGISVMIWAF